MKTRFTCEDVMKPETKLKKALQALTSAVIVCEQRIDDVMKQPSSPDRGRKIAAIINDLTIANQSALHFTLGYSFDDIAKMYQKEGEN